MNFTTWIIVAAFVLATPIIFYFVAKMLSAGWTLGRARARERLRKERHDNNGSNGNHHNHERWN